MTPRELARTPLAQLAALADGGGRYMSPAEQLEMLNRIRAKKGLPPLTGRRKPKG